MKIDQTPGAMKKFKRTSWRFQQTVQTPLGDLNRFVGVVIGVARELESACLTVDQVVFTPEALDACLAMTPAPDLKKDTSIRTSNSSEIAPLLRAALSCSIDFAFVTTPKTFALYADHDEYLTFYSNSKSGLSAVIQPIKDAGFILVKDWNRTF